MVESYIYVSTENLQVYGRGYNHHSLLKLSGLRRHNCDKPNWTKLKPSCVKHKRCKDRCLVETVVVQPFKERIQ